MRRQTLSRSDRLAELRVEDPDEVDLDALASLIAKAITPEALEKLRREQAFHDYKDDPVGFCEGVLGETLTEDVKEMMRSVAESKVTIAVSANGTGKTHGAARVALWFYLVHERAKVFTAAAPPLENLQNLLWGEILSVVRAHPDLFPEKPKSLELKRNPDEYLVGVTIPASGTPEEREAKFSGKHAPHLLFVLDEGDAIPDEVYRGIESCMSGGDAHLLVMLNPRKEAGATWRMQKEGARVVHLSAFTHPNVVEGKTIIPGAVDRETTVRRIHEWTRPLKKGEVFESSRLFDVPECLIGVEGTRPGGGKYPPLKAGTRVIMNPAFSYMVLGRYPAQASNQLISREWVNQARARWDMYVAKNGEVPPVGIPGIMGMDCAEMGDDYNAVCARYGGYVTAFSTWGGLDPIESGSRAVDWFNAHKCEHAYVDATGVGAGVAPQMNRLSCPATGLKGAESPTFATEIGEFRNLRAQLWWSLRLWLQKEEAMLPPDTELIEELLAPTYEVEKGKITVTSQKDLRLILNRSPNKADALRMTFGGKIGSFFEGCALVDEAPR